MQRERQNNQTKSSKEGYIIMPNNFLAEWIRVMGKGPVLLYIQLLTYCHKEKDIAWPALSTLGDSLNMSKNSLISYQKTLLEYGLIKKTAGGRTAQGNYRSNLYKVTPMRSPKNGPGQVQKLDTESPKIALDQAQNLHPNNTNLNITNLTATTKREKDAVAAVNFKKLKKEGDLSAPACAYPHADRCNAQAEEKIQAIRERMVELDFKEEFIEKILKEYPSGKIEEKLDLLMERKNIQSPAAWLSAALKKDYPPSSRGRKLGESVKTDSGQLRMDSRVRGNDIKGSGNDIDTPEWTSREKALKAIKLIQDSLSTCISPIPSGSRAVLRKKVGV